MRDSKVALCGKKGARSPLAKPKLQPLKRKLSARQLAESLNIEHLCETCADFMHFRLHEMPNLHRPCKSKLCKCRCKDPGVQAAEELTLIVGWGAGCSTALTGRATVRLGVLLPEPALNAKELNFVAASAKAAMLEIIKKRTTSE